MDSVPSTRSVGGGSPPPKPDAADSWLEEKDDEGPSELIIGTNGHGAGELRRSLSSASRTSSHISSRRSSPKPSPGRPHLLSSGDEETSPSPHRGRGGSSSSRQQQSARRSSHRKTALSLNDATALNSGGAAAAAAAPATSRSARPATPSDRGGGSSSGSDSLDGSTASGGARRQQRHPRSSFAAGETAAGEPLLTSGGKPRRRSRGEGGGGGGSVGGDETASAARARRDREAAHARQLANAALQDVYAATGGPRWKRAHWWLAPGSEVRLWYGASVERGALTALRLPKNSLRGALPPSLGNLPTIVLLDLSYNRRLGGELPACLGALAQLRFLNLCGCDFEGPLPESLGRLSQLQELRLSGNRLSGGLPTSWGSLTKLQELHVSSNELDGSIPASFSRMASLVALDLSNNKLEGVVPEQLGALLSLNLLRLEGNRLLTPLPAADSGPVLQAWLHKLLAVHTVGLELKLKELQRTKEEEVVRLAVALERSRRRVRQLEAQANGGGAMTDVQAPGHQRRRSRGRQPTPHAAPHANNFSFAGSDDGALTPSRGASPSLGASPDSVNSGWELQLPEPPAPAAVAQEPGFKSEGEASVASRGRRGSIGAVARLQFQKKLRAALGRRRPEDDEDDQTVGGRSVASGTSLGASSHTRGGAYHTDGEGARKRRGRVKTLPANLAAAADEAFDETRKGARSAQRKAKLSRMAISLERTLAAMGRTPSRSASLNEAGFRAELGDKAPTTREVAIVREFIKGGAVPPDVLDVLVDLAPTPYALGRFRAWASNNLLDENLDFYYDVGSFRTANDWELASDAKQILDMFVRPGADMEVNLSSTTRAETLARVTALLEALRARAAALGASEQHGSGADSGADYSMASMLRNGGMDPGLAAGDEEYQRICNELRRAFSAAESQVLDLLRLDAYPRFVAALNLELEDLIDGRALRSDELELVRAVVSYHEDPPAKPSAEAQAAARARLLKKRRRRTHRRRGRSPPRKAAGGGIAKWWQEVIAAPEFAEYAAAGTHISGQPSSGAPLAVQDEVAAAAAAAAAAEADPDVAKPHADGSDVSPQTVATATDTTV